MTQIIIGGGIAGIYAAYLIKKATKDRVILIEKSNQIGGLLRSFYYPEVGYFDYGIHTIYETGVAELDNFLYESLPKSEWILNEGHTRDFGGTYFNGVLQTNSPYLDLRSLPENVVNSCISDFFDNHQKLNSLYNNAQDYFKDKFGQTILENAIEPVLKKVYGLNSQDLDSFVAKILPLERLVLFDENIMNALIPSASMRSRLAYTDQLKLPEHLLPGKKSLYPKQYGMQNLINALEKKICSMGVEILNQSTLSNLRTDNNTVTQVTVNSPTQNFDVRDIRHIYCTTGLFTSAYLMNININPADWDKPLQTVIVNFGLRHKPKVKDLFYIYCFDENFISHRLACPSSFCESSYTENFYKLSVEVILKSPVSDPSIIQSKVISEMLQMNIFNPEDVSFCKVEFIEGGYPLNSCKNSTNTENLRNAIHELNLTNFTNIGLMSKKNLFFQTDIMKSIYDYFMDLRQV